MKLLCPIITWGLTPSYSKQLCFCHFLPSGTGTFDVLKSKCNYKLYVCYIAESIHSLGDIKHRTDDSIKPLCELDRSVLKTRVEVRDMNIYIKEL